MRADKYEGDTRKWDCPFIYFLGFNDNACELLEWALGVFHPEQEFWSGKRHRKLVGISDVLRMSSGRYR